LPRVPLHRLPRSVPNLPLRKKGPPTRLPQRPPLSPTHRPLFQVLELKLFRFGIRG
jgi:hypothetical protein